MSQRCHCLRWDRPGLVPGRPVPRPLPRLLLPPALAAAARAAPAGTWGVALPHRERRQRLAREGSGPGDPLLREPPAAAPRRGLGAGAGALWRWEGSRGCREAAGFWALCSCRGLGHGRSPQGQPPPGPCGWWAEGAAATGAWRSSSAGRGAEWWLSGGTCRRPAWRAGSCAVGGQRGPTSPRSLPAGRALWGCEGLGARGTRPA